MSNPGLIEVTVVGFAPAQQAGGFVVFLKDVHSNRCLPIVVGAAEAQAISLILNPGQLERPMTHDTFKNILDALRGEIKHVIVTRLEEHTFYADICLRNAAGDVFHLDARPSDAIALALKNGAQIYVAKPVMDVAGIELPENLLEQQQGSAPPTLRERLQAQLQKALEEENYEEAARLRDKLRALDAEQKGESEGEESSDAAPERQET